MSSEQQVAAVVNALANTLVQDANVRKPAEELLRSNETQTGFASTLLAAIGTQQVDLQSRLLAAIYLKNNILRYWRGVIAVRINDAEKDHIRQQILQLYAVVEEQIAHHLSIAITKIFVGDEPQHNSGVLQLLLQPVHSNLGQPASAATFRALEGFRAIVKPWARLHGYNFKASERIQLFRESAESIVGIVLPVWRQCVEAVMQAGLQAPVDLLNRLKCCTACLREMLAGHSQLEIAEAVIGEVFTALKALAAQCLSQPSEAVSSEMLSAVQSLGKFILKVQTKYPFVLVGSEAGYSSVTGRPDKPDASQLPAINGAKLQQYLSYLIQQLTQGLQLPAAQQRNASAILVPCACLLRGVLLCPDYRQVTGPRVGLWEEKKRTERRSEEQKQRASQIEQVIQSCMTQEVVNGLCSVLISSGLQLQPSDLEDWKNEPENFVLGGSQPKFDETLGETKQAWKRAEALKQATCAVLRSETQVALPVVLQLYENPQAPLLLKDAALHAVGLALENRGLGEEVNLSQWFATTLGPEFNKQNAPPEQVVLHRRIIWLVGKAREYLSQELKDEFCTLMVAQVSRPETDEVVKLTAASSLASLMEAIAEEPLVKNIEQEKDTIPLVRTLLEMFGAVASEMLRADLLKAVSGMMRVYRARSRIRYRKGIQGHDLKWPAGEMVLQAIPPLLQSMGQDSFLLRSIVVDVMSDLVLCGIAPETSIPLAVQIVDPCITMVDASDEALVLREAAQRLWRTVNTMCPPLAMVQPLFPRAVTLLEHDHGILLGEREVPLLIHILTDYFVIGDLQFCVQHAPEALHSVLHYYKATEITPSLRVSLLRLTNVLASLLGGTNELTSIMAPVYSLIFFHPSGAVAELWVNACSRYEVAYSLARIAMQSPMGFMQLMQHVMTASGQQSPAMYRKLVYHWLEATSKVSAPGPRLIVICGISALFTLDDPIFTQLIAEMVGVQTKLLHTALKPQELKRSHWREALLEARPERERRLLLCQVDVNADQIPNIVLARLQQCAGRVGHQIFQQLIAKLPAELQTQLQQLSAQFTPPHSPSIDAQVPTPKLINSPGMPPSPLPQPQVAMGARNVSSGGAFSL